MIVSGYGVWFRDHLFRDQPGLGAIRNGTHAHHPAPAQVVGLAWLGEVIATEVGAISSTSVTSTSNFLCDPHWIRASESVQAEASAQAIAVPLIPTLP
jgi:hypothetical protein